MTPPRRVLPGQVILLTRRCHERRYGLRPCTSIKGLFAYLLAAGCEKYQLGLVAAVATSTHYHLIVHDSAATFPAFLRWFNSLLSRAINHYRGQRDSLFSATNKPHAALLADPEAILAKTAYVLGNPVKDGAVRHGRDWPGFRTPANAHRRPPVTIARPGFFFAKNGALPPTAELRYTIPPGFDGVSPQTFSAQVEREVAEFEAHHRAERDRQGKPFLGPSACESASPDRKASTEEATGDRASEVVSREPSVRTRLLAELADFRDAYAAARSRFLTGHRGTRWPAGTWQMSRNLGVPVHPPP